MKKQDKEEVLKQAEELAGVVEKDDETQEAVQEENPLQTKLEEVTRQVEEYKDKWMRAVAEFENYKKRNAEIRRVSYLDGMTEVLVQVLPACDALERALQMQMDEKTREGVEMVTRKFSETLKNMGLEEINPAKGDAFDPNLHDALMSAPAEEGETEGTIKDVFVKGYKLNGKIVRYAQVRVVG